MLQEDGVEREKRRRHHKGGKRTTNMKGTLCRLFWALIPICRCSSIGSPIPTWPTCFSVERPKLACCFPNRFCSSTVNEETSHFSNGFRMPRSVENVPQKTTAQATFCLATRQRGRNNNNGATMSGIVAVAFLVVRTRK